MSEARPAPVERGSEDPVAIPPVTEEPLAELRTLSMIEARAHAILPPDVLAYAVGGSASEATLQRNRQALQHLAIEQRVLMGVLTTREARRGDTAKRGWVLRRARRSASW